MQITKLEALERCYQLLDTMIMLEQNINPDQITALSNIVTSVIIRLNDLREYVDHNFSDEHNKII